MRTTSSNNLCRSLFLLSFLLIATHFANAIWVIDGNLLGYTDEDWKYRVKIDLFYYVLNENDKTAELTGEVKTFVCDMDTHAYSSLPDSLLIPDTVVHNGVKYTVTTIGNNAFLNCRGITHVEIPPSVDTIGLNAFFRCSNLTSVKIATGLRL